MKKKRPPKSGGKAPRTGVSSAGTKWIPSAAAKSDSSLKDLVYAQPRAAWEWESSGGGGGGGTSITFTKPEINYIPDGGQIEFDYTVTPSGNSISVALATTSGTGQSTFGDGLTSQQLSGSGTITIKGVTVSSVVGNISLRADGTARRSFTVIRVAIQAKQPEIRNGEWIPETKDSDQQSVDGLIGAWSNTLLKIRVRFTPAGFKDSLPEDFIKWKSPYGENFEPNTIEHTFQPAGTGPKRIEIIFGALKLKRFVYVDVPDIGSYTQNQVGLILLGQLGGYARVQMIQSYADEATAWGQTFPYPQQDAMRHSYWMALCASDPTIGVDTALFAGRGHEVSAKQTAFLATMDIHNNDVGSLAVHSHVAVGPVTDVVPDRAAIQQDLLQRYQNGQLWIWEGDPDNTTNTDGLLIRSNRIKIFPTQEIIL